jgi:hypothetical protein
MVITPPVSEQTPPRGIDRTFDLLILSANERADRNDTDSIISFWALLADC